MTHPPVIVPPDDRTCVVLDHAGGRTHPGTLAAAVLTALLPLAILVAGIVGGRLRATPLEQLSAPYGFDLTEWEVRHLPARWLHLAGRWIKGAPSEQEQRREIARYFQLTAELNTLRGKRDEVVAVSADRTEIEALIAAREEEQRSLAPSVEAAIEGELTALLEELGLDDPLPIFDVRTVWPPVDVVVEDTPRVLITSPRDRIEQTGNLLLHAGLTVEQSEGVERQVDTQPNTSGLVVGTGGIAFYPAVIRPDFSFESTLEVAAHEWIHHWLYFHPLGSRYFDGGDIRTINETVANIAGRELGAMLRQRFAIEVPAPEAGLPAATAAPAGDAFDFRKEMRALRLAVDDLLTHGRVADAEALMEQKRLSFAEHGVYIRKLNQAYFAFYGTYGDSPASSNPLGPKIEQLRNRSASLTAFLRTAAGITSPPDVDALLASP